MPRTSPHYQTLRDMLVAARATAGLTQRDLAEKLSRQHSFIGKIESGSRNVDVIEFIEIARALDVDPAKLLVRLIKAAHL